MQWVKGPAFSAAPPVAAMTQVQSLTGELPDATSAAKKI